MTTGYPFMQLAARHHVDYGDVLLAADWCSGRQTDQTAQARNRLPGDVRTEINRLVLQPVGDRGGPHPCSCGKAHFTTEPCNPAPINEVSDWTPWCCSDCRSSATRS